MQIKDPLRIEVLRGGFQESLHLVHAVVTDSSGEVVEGWGDIDFLTFPRSAVKPLQAIPLILSGAEERFQMSTAELAMACSSHCLLYTSPSPRDKRQSRMPSSA